MRDTRANLKNTSIRLDLRVGFLRRERQFYFSSRTMYMHIPHPLTTFIHKKYTLSEMSSKPNILRSESKLCYCIVYVLRDLLDSETTLLQRIGREIIHTSFSPIICLLKLSLE